jgi:hypothetical protein
MEEGEDQEVRLAEYAALRAELAQRLSSQQALVALNLTAVATIVGFVLVKHSSKSLLLLVPVVSSVLGLLWLDHNRTVRQIATYIGTELWDGRTQSWEKWSGEKDARSKELLYWGAIATVYGVTSVCPLAVGWPAESASTGVWLLTAGGVLLTLLFLGAYVMALAGVLVKSTVLAEADGVTDCTKTTLQAANLTRGDE